MSTLTKNGVIRDVDGAFIPSDPRNSDWQEYQSWLGAGNSPTQSPSPTLTDLKAVALAALADRRWRAETGGTTVAGVPVKTDAASQGKLLSVYVSAKEDANYSVRFKRADGGFVTLDATQVISLALGVRAHVQACFDNEATLAAQINAASDEVSLATVDIDYGWPA